MRVNKNAASLQQYQKNTKTVLVFTRIGLTSTNCPHLSSLCMSVKHIKFLR